MRASLPHNFPTQGLTQLVPSALQSQHTRHALSPGHHQLASGAAVANPLCRGVVMELHTPAPATTTPTAGPRKHQQQPCLLLDLPEAALLKVLVAAAAINKADNAPRFAVAQRTLCSAARAHSGLHAAAAVILSHIRVRNISQPQLDSVLLYLSRHAHHICSVRLAATFLPFADPFPSLLQLPPLVHLTSLRLEGLRVQLLPAAGGDSGDVVDGPQQQQQQQQEQEQHQGVMQAVSGTKLKHLKLHNCILVDGLAGLETALAGLPALDSLSLGPLRDNDGQTYVTGNLLQQPQHLTCLHIRSEPGHPVLRSPDPLQHLSPLTALLELILTVPAQTFIMTSNLMPLQHLTSLSMSGYPECYFQPGVLEGKRLQHLTLAYIEPKRQGPAFIRALPLDVSALLSALQPLTQLTQLAMRNSLPCGAHLSTDYSALTASSLLRHLDLSQCRMPDDMWEHVLPTGRRLPHLRVLKANILKAGAPGGIPVTLPADFARITSSCPGLQQLVASWALRDPSPSFPALRTLTDLQRLELGWVEDSTVQALAESCAPSLSLQLQFQGSTLAAPVLLHLTQLTQLTELNLMLAEAGSAFTCKAPGDTPVAEQLLNHCQQMSETATEVEQLTAA